MKIVTFTTLFPNQVRPSHGIFVETRLRHLVASGAVSSRVVAPVPWFPFRHQRFGRYGDFARVPATENRHGLDVVHPRYPVVPKVGMNLAPAMLAQGARGALARLIDEGHDFDLIDAHYFYPDGVAAVQLGRYFNKPVVITARGSDISLIPRHPVPRRLIQWAAANAAHVITVCDALKTELGVLGADPARITPLRNGVDLEHFRPADREPIRARLALEGFTLLSVGHLVPLKGHDLVVGALPLLPDATLMIAGDGPERPRLESLARELGVEQRVRFLGVVSQPELADYYNAADVLVLASSREGWANVLLEAMACGTPVVASRVWGTPEVVASDAAGILMEERSARGVADGVRLLRAGGIDRAATRRYAEGFSWEATTDGQLRLFSRIMQR
ncbi:glycosyltransferase family 4 protein [Massilia yuzhufengensis]|uniref:Glycosyltransferase involved in cell wall bisynthesis n=1 Tax=Massilia yuzhufengensis TaxID=1164594 RepID=A0A1I1DJA2_9BURK|nr:glycosyltransferase family 4 protein [Massilia yuzhufengensis]SFB75025.1 Glycosyltransferase involved in cell wall bisynthesis [Massilia yuzhufengensis]